MPCPFDQMHHCVLQRKVRNAMRDRSLKTCQICPDEFPWLGNPDGGVLPVSCWLILIFAPYKLEFSLNVLSLECSLSNVAFTVYNVALTM